VYQAEHVDLEKRVALKTLLGASARDPRRSNAFARGEGQHPNNWQSFHL